MQRSRRALARTRGGRRSERSSLDFSLREIGHAPDGHRPWKALFAADTSRRKRFWRLRDRRGSSWFRTCQRRVFAVRGRGPRTVGTGTFARAKHRDYFRACPGEWLAVYRSENANRSCYERPLDFPTQRAATSCAKELAIDSADPFGFISKRKCVICLSRGEARPGTTGKFPPADLFHMIPGKRNESILRTR